MRGDEQRVVDAFAAWLEEQGWTVRREVDFCDLVATRPGETLYVEAKGRTEAIGTDVDPLYGQLLRRMPIAEDSAARFAAVVPTEGVAAAARVPDHVREILLVDLYEVDEAGAVSAAG